MLAPKASSKRLVSPPPSRAGPTLKPTVLRKFPADKYPSRRLVGIETVIGIYPMQSLI